MYLSCGHTYHVQCITKSATLCLSKICPICRSPLPHEFLTTLRLHEEAVNHWNDTLQEFKQRTGHNIDCIYDGCHKLSKQNIVVLKIIITLYTEAAVLGNTSSARLLGMSYEKGFGTDFPKDYNLALYWLNIALELGSEDTHLLLLQGFICIQGGFGVNVQADKGRKFLKLAAEKNHAGAQFTLGCLLRNEDSLMEKKEGLRLLQLAALQNSTEAMCHIGMTHYEGQLTERSYEKAFFLFKTAAERDMTMAMYLVSGCYSRGQGVTQQENETALWLSRAEKKDELNELQDFVNNWFNKHAP
jgi:TPR repeat protein